MMDHRVSRRYAGALFGLADKAGDLDRAHEDFLHIRKMVAQHPEITHLALNSTISQSEKEDLMDKLFGPQISPLLIHFLKVLIEKRRFDLLFPIQEEFHRRYEKKRGIQHVEVISAFTLSAQVESRLLEALKNKFKSEVRLQSQVDPSILGGLIIRYNHDEIDAGFKGRILKMRQLLLN